MILKSLYVQQTYIKHRSNYEIFYREVSYLSTKRVQPMINVPINSVQPKETLTSSFKQCYSYGIKI